MVACCTIRCTLPCKSQQHEFCWNTVASRLLAPDNGIREPITRASECKWFKGREGDND